MERFSKKQSIEFLKAGFQELNISINERIIEKAVRKLDGIVGWLALFGYVVSETRRLEEKTLKRFQDMAIKLVESEIKKLERRSRRYISILKAISMGIRNWSKIKAEVERMERRGR